MFVLFVEKGIFCHAPPPPRAPEERRVQLKGARAYHLSVVLFNFKAGPESAIHKIDLTSEAEQRHRDRESKYAYSLGIVCLNEKCDRLCRAHSASLLFFFCLRARFVYLLVNASGARREPCFIFLDRGKWPLLICLLSSSFLCVDLPDDGMVTRR